MNKALYLGLGSNEGDRQGYIRQAVALLQKRWNTPCEALSNFHETEPWGLWNGDAAPFLNAVARFRVPEDFLRREAGSLRDDQALFLLSCCKAVERELGREETLEVDEAGRRIYHPRTIDIDLLLWGEETVDLPTLRIPHPLMAERDFVLKPLSEVAEPELKIRLFLP